MNADMFAEATEYELLTKVIYQAILHREGIANVNVEHNVGVAGRSGVLHQIDVLWRFKQAGIEHLVLIECKNYSTALTLDKVRNFFAVCHDIGNARGLMVTRTGFQSGAVEFGKFYGIELKLLRKPTAADWEGRIKDIHLRARARYVASAEHPVDVAVELAPRSQAQYERLARLEAIGLGRVSNRPGACLLDENRVPVTDEFRWWLPRQLEVWGKEDGGPYVQRIELNDKYLLVDEGLDSEELVPVAALVCTYYVESATQEIISHGEELVQAVLKDFSTQDIEYFHVPIA